MGFEEDLLGAQRGDCDKGVDDGLMVEDRE